MVLWWTTIWWRFCYGTEKHFPNLQTGINLSNRIYSGILYEDFLPDSSEFLLQFFWSQQQYLMIFWPLSGGCLLCRTILPPVTTLTDLLSVKQRCGTISDRCGLPGIPLTFCAEEIARLIILFILDWSATTRLVVSESSCPVGPLLRGVEEFQVNDDVNMLCFSHSRYNESFHQHILFCK